jgi:hypothetical protein
MDAPPVRYDRWKAPSEDGKVLLWPEAQSLLSDTLDNQKRLSGRDDVLLQNVPLSQVRSAMRQWLGHDDTQPLIATAHQAELHHAGVWAKNALIDAVATKVEGRAFHFAVDTDEPKHLNLRWPGGAVSLVDDPAALRAKWSGLLPQPSPAHLREIERELEQAASNWNFVPMTGEFFASLRRVSLLATTLPAALSDALHRLDWELGLRYDLMLFSPICLSEPYLLFAHHVLARAGEFASQYNAALEQFRHRNRIKNLGRPMPNLNVAEEACEVPFWLDSLATGERSRASVRRINAKWVIEANGDVFIFDPAADGWVGATALLLWLRKHGLRLAPRALILTCVLRLLVADQFVHGIGGAQYDQVLDDLIARHLGMEPPRFSVTTATLYFPTALGQLRVCLPCIAQEGHRLKHRILGEEKMKLVQEIAALPRRSAERGSLFHKMHRELSVASSLPQIRQWEQRLREAEAQAQEQRTLFDRELFCALQPRDRLTAVIDRYRALFA